MVRGCHFYLAGQRGNKEVLARLGVRRNLIGEVINLLREEAQLVEIRVTSDASPDPDDNAFCACAEQGRAAFLVTLRRPALARQAFFVPISLDLRT